MHLKTVFPNVWREISQILIEHIKPIGQMSDELWNFFGYNVENVICKMVAILLGP